MQGTFEDCPAVSFDVLSKLPLVTAAGEDVQYIEPYPKSQALDLHDEAIQIRAKEWVSPSHSGKKVFFRPFFGGAPRLFGRAFLKDRDLKNKEKESFCGADPDAAGLRMSITC
jgi:hypothetical protein